MADEAPVTNRRSFLKTITALLAAGAAALATVPVLGSVLSPLLRPKEEDAGLLRAVPLADLQEGVPKRVELISTVIDGWTRAVGVVGAVWLLKGKDGSVTALSSVCPHSGLQHQPEARRRSYGCPCHESRHSSSTARRPTAPHRASM